MSIRIQSECGKMRTKKTPNWNTFYPVDVLTSKIVKRLLLFIITSLFKLGETKYYTV